jgi:uncharacterized protein (TIGR03000 family)
MMRKTLLILSLAGLTVLAAASDAFAQRRGYSGGRGYAPSISVNVGRGAYYSPYGYYGGRAYSPYYQGYGYSYAPSYYYAEPTYVVPATQIRQAYYPAPVAAQQSARMIVLVPAAGAQVWFDGNATSQQGLERVFESPSLEPGHNFSYTVKARWLENGQAVTRERRVNVQAGQSVTVNFREMTGEGVAPPLPKLPNAIPRQ